MVRILVFTITAHVVIANFYRLVVLCLLCLSSIGCGRSVQLLPGGYVFPTVLKSVIVSFKKRLILFGGVFYCLFLQDLSTLWIHQSLIAQVPVDSLLRFLVRVNLIFLIPQKRLFLLLKGLQ